MVTVTSFGRQLLRDERQPRTHRMIAFTREIVKCLEAEAYDAALVVAFIELDTWAYLMRPAAMRRHTQKSFEWFIAKYLHSDPAQPYQYTARDVYAARCGMLHTFGSLSDLHQDPSTVVWRFHLGKSNTYVPGMDRMAYISVKRFLDDAFETVRRCMDDIKTDKARNKLVGERLPRMYYQAGVLPSRDPDAIAAMDADIDAEIAEIAQQIDTPRDPA